MPTNLLLNLIFKVFEDNEKILIGLGKREPILGDTDLACSRQVRQCKQEGRVMSQSVVLLLLCILFVYSPASTRVEG